MKLLELYEQAYPEYKGDAWRFHMWTQAFNLGVCVTEVDKQLYDSEYKLACEILESIINKK